MGPRWEGVEDEDKTGLSCCVGAEVEWRRIIEFDGRVVTSRPATVTVCWESVRTAVWPCWQLAAAGCWAVMTEWYTSQQQQQWYTWTCQFRASNSVDCGMAAAVRCIPAAQQPQQKNDRS